MHDVQKIVIAFMRKTTEESWSMLEGYAKTLQAHFILQGGNFNNLIGIEILISANSVYFEPREATLLLH